MARTAEPITSGVPFAEGTLTDASRLRLLDNGTEIPAQFLVTARWPDGSIRWALVDFQADLPASGSRAVTLQTSTAHGAVAGISVADSASTLTVDTRARVFTFNKSEFVLRGASFQASSGGTTYTATPTAWTIEEQGPMKVVVRIDGVWRQADRPLVNDLNRFRARLVFHRDKGDARAFLTFRNNNSFGFDTAGGGQPQQPDLTVTGATLGAATLLPAGGSYVFGSGVEKTWDVVIADNASPTLRTTRFAADGTLVGGDAAPRPLALPSAAYFASTRAWGRIVNPLAGHAADRQADFDLFERIQRAKVDRSVVQDPPGLRGITAFEHLSSDIASWNNYGDLRWAGNGCGVFSSNHYDWVYGMYLQFMRTGLVSFADLAGVLARHEIDFDLYHTGADSPAFNYQRTWEDRPSHDNPGNCFGGGRPSHTWSQGYALHWLLTGDWRGKDGFDEIQEGVRQYVYESFNGEGYITTSELRVQGWLIENLVNLWRIDPTATLATTSYGAKTIPAAIKNILQGVLDIEAAAGQQGFVVSDDDPNLRQTVMHAYFLEPAIKAHDEVFAGRDAAYASTLLSLVQRMTTWLNGTVIGGDTNGSGAYRPRQIPYWVDTRLAEQTDGQPPYLMMVANAAGYLYSATGTSSWRDQARAVFRDWVRYAGAIAPNSYGDPSLRTPAAYNSHIFVGTESKIHGWSSRFLQYYLAAESDGSAPPPAAQLTVTPGSLRFGATKAGAGGSVVSVTPAQTLTVSVAGTPTSWTAAANVTWLQLTNAAGTGAGQFTAAVVNPGNVLGGATTLAGTITVTPTADGAAVVVPVTLTLDQTGGAATVGPFGQVDTPAQHAVGVQGAIGVTGWAVDDIGVTGVKIYRNCLAFDNPASCQMQFGFNVVFIGDAAFVPGARPDVEAAYASYPQAYRAGWGYLMLTNMLPHVTGGQVYGGQGPLTLYAIAIDAEGKTTLLGRTAADSTPTTITMTNDSIAKPFGAIDTPGQGETISGAAFANFGWVLTRDNNTTGGEPGDVLIPTNGSTATVFIDGAPVATVAYNQCRGTVGNPVPAGVFCNDDVANIFGNETPQPVHTLRTSNPTRYRNLDAGRGAIGAYVLNTTLLANGMHSIAWGVTDSGGATEGIGSRNFVVLNAGAASDQKTEDRRQETEEDRADAVMARVGFDLRAPYEALPPDDDGVHHVQIPELGRLELQLGPVEAGYLVANGELRDLPPGSRLDPETGVFTWAPVAGFIGTYRLAFGPAIGQKTGDRGQETEGDASRWSRDRLIMAGRSWKLALASFDTEPAKAGSHVCHDCLSLVVDVTIRPITSAGEVNEVPIWVDLDAPGPPQAPAAAAPEVIWSSATYDTRIASLVSQVSESELRSHVVWLEGLGTRYFTTATCAEAASGILQRFQQLGLDAAIDSFSIPGYSGSFSNIVATKPGRTSPSNIVILGAHYDSTAQRNASTAAPGADDNASGTAAVLEIARVLSTYTFDYTIVFIAFAAEEAGFYGSEHYAQAARQRGDQILGMINLDMIAYVDRPGEDINLGINSQSRWLADRYASTAQQYVTVPTKIATSDGSDQDSFWRYGYSAILVIDDDPPTNPNYHKATDTSSTLDFPFFTTVTQASLAVVADLAQPIGPAVSALNVTPGSLRFGATKAGAGGNVVSVTPAQTLTVGMTGTSTSWTAAANVTWLQLTNSTGTGAGQFTAAVVNPGNVLGGSTTLAGTITVTPASADSAAVVVPVSLSIDQTGGAATAGPFGQVDTPAQNAVGVQGAIGVTGWAVDDIGVSGVKIYRNCLGFDNPASCQILFGNNVVFIGDAAFVAGARPDVEAAYSSYPQAYRAGWGYLMLTNMLPHVTGGQVYGGQGPLTLFAIATDAEGKTTLLGRTAADSMPTAITMANDSIAKPFGAIDAPGQGATVSGAAYANFGWVLTRDADTVPGNDGAGREIRSQESGVRSQESGARSQGAGVEGAGVEGSGDTLVPPNGATAVVFIDGAPVATVAYNQCRGTVGNPVPAGVFCNDDVANIFGNPTPQPVHTTRTANPTRYRNLDAGRGAIGAYVLNTTLLANGMHSIAWGVTDSGGATEGIGSRDFTVLNTGTDAARDPGPGIRDPGAARQGRVGWDGPGQALNPGPDEADAVMARVGFDLRAPYEALLPDDDGVHRVQIPELGRLELQLGPVEAGYLVANGELRDLPPGSRLDPETGVFTWAPVAGFIGTYRLAFGYRQESGVRSQESGGVESRWSRDRLIIAGRSWKLASLDWARDRLASFDSEPAEAGSHVCHDCLSLVVDVNIRPITSAVAADEAQIRMHLDAPAEGNVVEGVLHVTGWALDPQAAIGSGIQQVHVWAWRRDVPGAEPVFLGNATLGLPRPDIARDYGAQFGRAGFSLNVDKPTGSGRSLEPGEYNITAYVWNIRTARWEDARTARVRVR